MYTRKQQGGFTIITVLLLILMGSIIVIHSLKDNIVQERLSGNFQKKINARLLSEKGIFDAYDTFTELLTDDGGLSIAELITITNNGNITGQGSITNSGYNVAISETSSGEITITSIGERYEGEHTLSATFTLLPGGSASPFSHAVVGCEGVTLNGSGTINSYDSEIGNYSSSIAEKEGDVVTIDPGSDVVLNGHSPIYGDVQSTGGISLGGSSPVYGNLHASGDIFINQSIVDGYVWAVGGYELKGGTVKEYVRANDYGKMGWGAIIENINNYGLDILYGGANKFKDTTNNSHYAQAKYQVNPNIQPVPEHDPTAPDYDASDPATNCDPIGISSIVTVIDDGQTSLTNLSIGATQSYQLNTIEGRYTANGSSVLTPTTSTVFGNANTQIFKVADFKLASDAMMKVTGGDVILFVDGSFSMAGNTKLYIEADSSLTVIITGKFSVAGSAQIIAEQEGLTTTGQPAMSLYSSFDGVNGVKISGASDIYAAIYAPLTDVDVVGSGAVMGSIRAKYVTVSGGGGVHFDSALTNAVNGSFTTSSSRLVLKTLKYF